MPNLLSKAIYQNKTCLWLAIFGVIVLSGQVQAQSKQHAAKQTWCDKPIDYAVRQGSSQFTKRMVNNLTKEAMRMNRSKSEQEASQCIIVGLQNRRLPYEF